ncbi:MAG: class I SAM-dependent methyltransferase [Nanoarchaeota archaeon]
MKPLPPAQTYERELEFMPYRDSIHRVVGIITRHAPKSGTVLDLMCGPGYLLGLVSRTRPDLSLQGVDIDPEYIKHARQKYPEHNFQLKDVLEYGSAEHFDVIACTGALHHIPYKRQEEVIQRMAYWLNPSGTAILSDCYIGDYSTEKERKLEAARLGYEYLKETIKNGAPDDVIQATADIISNDVLADGEFKTSLAKRLPLMQKYFHNKITTTRSWPRFARDNMGDFITILEGPKK